MDLFTCNLALSWRPMGLDIVGTVDIQQAGTHLPPKLCRTCRTFETVRNNSNQKQS